VIIVLEDEIEDLVVNEAKIEEVRNVDAEVVEDRLLVATKRTRYKLKPYRRLVE